MSDGPCVKLRSGAKPLRIFHAYKIYRPDIEGGIPAVISCLAQDGTDSHSILAARRFGWGQRCSIDDAPVEAVASLGNFFFKPVGPFYIPAFGRLVGYRGFDCLCGAVRGVDAQATIVGEGPLLAGLQQLATELGVSDRIRFAGRVDRSEIKTILHSANVLAFPSVTEAEAFGIAQIEAMAAGLPIVNTQLPTTVPLVARHDREALTVPPNDPLALSQALNSVLNEPGLAARLGAAGRERANSEFDEDIFRDRITTVYRDAMRAREEAKRSAAKTPHQ